MEIFAKANIHYVDSLVTDFFCSPALQFFFVSCIFGIHFPQYINLTQKYERNSINCFIFIMIQDFPRFSFDLGFDFDLDVLTESAAL